MIKNNNLLGYMQILQIVGDRIVDGIYKVDGRIPSVRDMAVEMEVNPITVFRAYERLQMQGAIYVKRGMGYFVAEDGVEILRKERIDRFWNEDMPEIKRKMLLLQISPEELVAQLQMHTPNK